MEATSGFEPLNRGFAEVRNGTQDADSRTNRAYGDDPRRPATQAEGQKSGQNLRDLIRWYLDRLDHPPVKVHARGVWHDRRDGAGSQLGSPALTTAFELWLHLDHQATTEETVSVACYHGGTTYKDREAGRLCPACSVRDEHGVPIVETGKTSVTRLRYRAPMRAALARLRRIPVKSDRPDLAFGLSVLAACSGDTYAAASTLQARYPRFADLGFAVGYFMSALRRVRSEFSEEVPWNRVRTWRDNRGKSDAHSTRRRQIGTRQPNRPHHH